MLYDSISVIIILFIEKVNECCSTKEYRTNNIIIICRYYYCVLNSFFFLYERRYIGIKKTKKSDKLFLKENKRW